MNKTGKNRFTQTGPGRTALALTAGLLILMAAGCTSMKKNRIGMEDGVFRPCPDSPNCVSSMTGAAGHVIAPISYSGLTRDEAVLRILSILQNEERCRIISNDGYYIHTEFRSKIFRFVDDVEFWFPPESGVIHLKSASRLGYSDMGVNRERVEHLRSVFNQ